MRKDILSASPKSFKMRRKSALASKLKSSISENLFRFLGCNSDDVLAEYITVLVCNGKHQYQVREELKAFLGERSKEFVSWLWDTLLNFAIRFEKDICLPDAKVFTVTSASSNGDKDPKNNELKELQNHSSGSPDDLLGTMENIHHLPAASYPVSCSDMHFDGKYQQLSGYGASCEVISKTRLLQSWKKETPGRVDV